MMLTRRQKAQLDRVATLIGEDVVLKDGALYAQNTLRIDGQYRGEINSQGAVIIGTGGIVEGSIQGENIIVSGRVSGDIKASNQVHIRDTGSVSGDISCFTIIIEEGGIFVGNCHINKPEAGETVPKTED
jgi:cytoskeletal protein CcmA (bactofilin family)